MEINGGGGGSRTFYVTEGTVSYWFSKGQNDKKAWNAESTVRFLYGPIVKLLPKRSGPATLENQLCCPSTMRALVTVHQDSHLSGKPTFRPYGSSAVVGERIGDYALIGGPKNISGVRQAEVAIMRLFKHCEPVPCIKGLTNLELRLRPFDTPDD